MKKYLFILSAILVLFLLSILSNNHSSPKQKNEKVIELGRYVKKIRSISPKDTNFSDFSFLDKIIKEKSIILLGEQIHKGGATFLAKARLVKYLHEEHNFDVIIYEAGLYDTYNLWNNLKSNSERRITEFSKALFPFWYNNEENKELLNYILNRINSQDEIEIAGLDVQFSGQLENEVRDSTLSEYLSTVPTIYAKKFPSFYSIKDQYNSYVTKWSSRRMTKSKKDSILADLQSIASIIAEQRVKSERDSIHYLFFKNLELLYNYSWNYKYGSSIRFHLRDSAMAENFIWLKENKFKNRKVVVWAANLHTSYSNNSYSPIPANMDFTPMGEYIKKKYGSSCYSINFTSFSDELNLNKMENIYNNKSIEYLMHQLNEPYLYLDFNTVDSASFLRQETIMNCNHGLSFKANWDQICDAIFYIDHMTTLHQLKK